jgi:hypothetical protein
MEVIIHNVGELGQPVRSAAETLVGHALDENQQLVIQVLDLEARNDDGLSAADRDDLPDWCNVYDGMSDEQIAALEQAISHRLDLKRSGT